MTAYAQTRGNEIIFTQGKWRYAVDMKIEDGSKPCIKCGKMPDINGIDACLGKIDGVESACCGHGVEKPYII